MSPICSCDYGVTCWACRGTRHDPGYFDPNADPERNDPAEQSPADERPSEYLVSE